MHKNYYIVTLVLLFIAMLLSDEYLPRFEPLSFKPVEEKKQTANDFFIEDLTTTVMHKNGQPDYQVTASYVIHLPDKDLVKLDNVSFTLFQASKPTWSASAAKGVMENRAGIIHLKDKVVLHRPESKTDEAVTLTTSELHIYNKRNLAETKSRVQIKSGNNQIDAVGMRLFLDEGRIELLSSIKTRYDRAN